MNDEVYRTNVGKKIVELRLKRGIRSSKRVADELGFKDSIYRKYETDTIPPAPKLAKIADFFGVSVDYLMSEDEDTQNDDYVPVDSGSANGSLPLSNYDGYQPLDEEIGDLTEQEALLISILRSADKEDKKKIVKYIKKIRDKK